jgi:sporulation protein YlmC with PRC-barrel domain
MRRTKEMDRADAGRPGRRHVRAGSRRGESVTGSISIHAVVLCRDGQVGKVKEVIVDPIERRLKHLVVLERGLLYSERVVPLELVERSADNEIWLSCTREQVHELDDYLDVYFVDTSLPTPPRLHRSEAPIAAPVVMSKRIPEGEVALGRWALVEATDGPIGRVGSLVVDMVDGRISHVVVLTHRFLPRREVAVPVDRVDHFYSRYVQLNVGRREIERLARPPARTGSEAAGSSCDDLVAEGPGDAGIAPRSDASRVEAAHLLADEVGPRLRPHGFTEEEILEWAKAFLDAEHSGGAAELVHWIGEQERLSGEASTIHGREVS